jgi:hypothetical protein
MRKVYEVTGPKCIAKVYKNEYEYVVRFFWPIVGRVEDADYFTNDKQDAIGTANLEAGV